MVEENFACSRDGMAAAQAFLESHCDEPKPAIIMDEIVSNIVRCSGAEAFAIGFDRTEKGIEMTFTDNGAAFDPTQEVASPDLTAPVAEREVGGLGIFMVKKMAKSVAYRRDGQRNVLKVVL